MLGALTEETKPTLSDLSSFQDRNDSLQLPGRLPDSTMRLQETVRPFHCTTLPLLFWKGAFHFLHLQQVSKQITSNSRGITTTITGKAVILNIYTTFSLTLKWHKKMLTCDILHFRQAAIKPVHCLQKLSSVAFSLEWRQDQHLAARLQVDNKKGETWTQISHASNVKVASLHGSSWIEGKKYEVALIHQCSKSHLKLICKLVFKYKSL